VHVKCGRPILIRRALYALERFVSVLFMYISMGMLLFMMLLGSADVLGRYFLGKPITGAFELTEILLAGIVYFALAHTQRMKAHVAVSLFYSFLPQKMKARVGFFDTVVSMCIFGLISWRGIVTAISQWQQHRMVSNLGWPHFIFQLFVPAGSLAICLVLILEMLQPATEMRKGD
jgi:TRAP-type C4-dicarboxylate transport system permease small subunit